MAIDGNISDLFFNTDVSVTIVNDDKGNFVDFDDERLREEARMFLGCLERLNVTVPSINDLIADFRARV